MPRSGGRAVEMQSVVHKELFAEEAGVERRAAEQPQGRRLGRVIACDGARATIAGFTGDAVAGVQDLWAIGQLLTINMENSRIVGLVYELATPEMAWSEKSANPVHIKVELIGEVIDDRDLRPRFRRGLLRYPHIGAIAHRIRAADLAAVYDLGERQGVEIGRVSQDQSIAATVSIHDMLNRHFAVVGSTGVGKSTAVSLLLRKAVEYKK